MVEEEVGRKMYSQVWTAVGVVRGGGLAQQGHGFDFKYQENLQDIKPMGSP